MVSKILIATTLAALVTAQTCTAGLDPAHPRKDSELVCGRIGVLNPRLDFPFRTFPSPNGALGCGVLCTADPMCISLKYNIQTEQCDFYQRGARRMGFTVQSKSETQFYHKRCFLKRGDCGFLNGDFETNLQGSNTYDGANINYAPWEFTSAGLQNADDTASLQSSSNSPHSSGGQYYFEMTAEGDSTASVSQDIILEPDTEYSVNFLYNLFPSDSLASYELSLTYGGAEFATIVLDDSQGWRLTEAIDTGNFPTFISGSAPGNGLKKDGAQTFTVTLQQNLDPTTGGGSPIINKRIVAPLASATLGLDSFKIIKSSSIRAGK